MDSAKWQQVKLVFSAALEQPAGNVVSYIEQAAGADEELKIEVNRLLFEHMRAGDFLEKPVVGEEWNEDRIRVGSSGSPFAGTDRFVIKRKLGAGGFGEVYEAFDRQHNEAVALKCLRVFNPEQLYRLKTEFRTLSDLRHPNLIQVYELHSGSEPVFFTMELLRGRDFASYLEEHSGEPSASAGRSLRLEQLLGYLTQLSAGVMALHRADLLHRDIKPSNIFITDQDRVVLLDLGLVKRLAGPESSLSMSLAGTPSYLAPEHLHGDRLTRATDWYSVGAVLYQALTSRAPFDGGILQMLARNRDEEPAPPSSLVQGLPPALDLLCRELLRPDPGARPGGDHVIQVLQTSGKTARSPGIESADSSAGRVFVCREEQLEALKNAFEASEDGNTICVHVRGASGSGKSATVRRFLEDIHRHKPTCVMLSGRCYESEAAPHKGLDELTDKLARFLKGLESTKRQLMIPRYFGLLTKLFPVLQGLGLSGGKTAEIPDLREQRLRAFGSLRECLRRISEAYPLILWIDDLQWGDFETVRVLNDLVHNADPFPCLILLSYRHDNIPGNPVLSALNMVPAVTGIRSGISVLQIDNLPFEGAKELAAALLDRGSGSDWSTTVEMIARESNGNPHFISELVRYGPVLSEGAQLGAGAFGIRHVIRRRVGLLPEPALRLLELVAVAGQPLLGDVCAKATRMGESYFATRGMLLREQLLRTLPSEAGEELELFHDQIRTAIVSYLSPEALRVYHGLLAQALDEDGSDEHERLAVHWEAAGNREEALIHMRIAAEQAVNVLAFERAAKMYRKIYEIGGTDALDRQMVLERLGMALSNAGRGKEAADAFLAASEGCTSYRRLDLHRRACEQHLRNGHLADGMRIGKDLLEEVGLRFPNGDGTVLALLLWSRFRLRLQSFRRIQKNTETLTRAKAIRLDVCWTFSLGMSMVDVLRGAYFQAQYTLLALKSGEPSRVSLGLSAELAMGAIDNRRGLARTERTFRTAVQLAEDVGDYHALGFANSMRGVVSWLSGNWLDCYERNKLAGEIYREKCSGVLWELTTANAFVLSSLVFLGRWKEHALALPELAQQAEERGDKYGAVSLPLLAYGYVDYLAQDQPQEAHQMILRALSVWRDEEFHLQHCDALFGQIETFLYEGDANRAYDLLERQWQRLKSSNLLEIGFNRIFATALRSRTALAAAILKDCPAGRASSLIRLARRDAARLTRQKTSWGRALGFLLHSGIASTAGEIGDARIYLRLARELFEGVGMEHYAAVATLREVQLGSVRGVQAPSVDSGWMELQGIRNPGRIMDMLAPGTWTVA
jgi:hypothetical protein